MRRTSIQVALLFLAGAVGVAVGCSNGDTTGSNGTGGSSGTGTGGNSSGTGGGSSATGGVSGAGTGGNSVGTGGATTSTGGSSATGGSPGTGGATTSTGGSPGTGGATTSTGGVSGTGGATTSTGGSSGGAGASGFGQPACAATVAKGGTCAATDAQMCYKTCGPSGAGGVKLETCTNGAYMEMSGCSFNPANDYSCYKIVTPQSSSCPTAMPMANAACTVATCTPCNLNGMYADSSGKVATGYCVCTTSGKWTCATVGTTSTAWPCPGNTGC